MRTEEYIPKRVKELCSKHKVSKYRLAQLTDMSQTALANIMNKKSIPQYRPWKGSVMHSEFQSHSSLPEMVCGLT